MKDLNRRMAVGAAWLILFRLLERGIGFISTLILARLLVPADFGLVAMATSILAGLELLGAFSFDIALIQNQRAERRHYDTAWTFGVCFGLFKSLAMCALAVPAAHFFREPRVEHVMYALALCTAVVAFKNVGIVGFQKDLELHKEFKLGLARKLAGFAVTITLAFLYRSYWALIAGVLAMNLTSLVLSYRMHPYRPRLNLSAAGELFGYSKWLLLNNLLIFLNNRGTDFIVGRSSGASALGVYSIAYEVANLPTTELVFPVSRAVFPGYAKLSGDIDKLRAAFLDVVAILALLTVPAGTIIGLVAEPLVVVLLGHKWLDAVPLIGVLALFGIVRALHGPLGSIYLAVGKPRIVAVLQCIQLTVAISLMVVLVPRWAALGAAWALLCGAALAASINYVLAVRELRMRWSEVGAILWRPALGAAAAAAALAGLDAQMQFSTETGPQALKLAAMAGAAGAAYTATVFACWFLARRPAGAETQVIRLVRARFVRRDGDSGE